MSMPLQGGRKRMSQEARESNAAGRPDHSIRTDGEPRLKQGLCNHGTICPRVMEQAIKMQISGPQ